MVPTKEGGAGDVTAVYAELLQMMGCLVNQVRCLVECSTVADRVNRIALSGGQVKISSDATISRKAIYTEARE